MDPVDIQRLVLPWSSFPNLDYIALHCDGCYPFQSPINLQSILYDHHTWQPTFRTYSCQSATGTSFTIRFPLTIHDSHLDWTIVEGGELEPVLYQAAKNVPERGSKEDKVKCMIDCLNKEALTSITSHIHSLRRVTLVWKGDWNFPVEETAHFTRDKISDAWAYTRYAPGYEDDGLLHQLVFFT